MNVHDRAEQLLAHVGERAHVSLEAELMGTGGALGILRPWIDGRDVLLLNVDCVHDADLATFVASWSPESIAFLLAEPGGTEFGPGVRLVATLMPWSEVATRPVERHSVFSRSWVPAAEAGTVETNWHAGAWFDCGTPEQYLAANLWCSGGVSVVGAEAVVDGTIEKCVVWDGAWVRPQERLVAAIRTTNGRTVLVR